MDGRDAAEEPLVVRPVHRVVVGVDGSPQAEVALRCAIREAKAWDAELVAVTGVPVTAGTGALAWLPAAVDHDQVLQDVAAALDVLIDRVAAEADVVITHAGVGTLLGMLEQGIHPLMVVRRAERGEHVDDHQEQIAELVNRLGIGHAVEVEDLDAEALAEAARWEIVDRHVHDAAAVGADA